MKSHNKLDFKLKMSVAHSLAGNTTEANFQGTGPVQLFPKTLAYMNCLDTKIYFK